MTLFEQFVFIYFISATAIAGLAVLWRNWLEDYNHWKDWLERHFGVAAKTLTCGSCFTFWLTLFFVFIFDPLGSFFRVTQFADLFPIALYAIQWMSLGYGALFLRFFYVALQEVVNILVHEFRGKHQ